MPNPVAYYAACQTLVLMLQQIAEAFIRGSYAPASLAPLAQTIGNLGIQALTLNVAGGPLYATISAPPVVNRYNPAYVAGLNTYLNTIIGNTNTASGQLNFYAAGPGVNTDAANAIMTLIMELEISTNNFRDPFNMGYPPFFSFVALDVNPTQFNMEPVQTLAD